MPISRSIYKKCRVCGKEFPIMIGDAIDLQDLSNLLSFTCDSCKRKKKKL